MGFIDPAFVFVRWGTFTISAGQTTATITHGASFTPDRVILFPEDAYAWAGQAVASSYTGTQFTVTIIEQPGDAAFQFVVGKN